LTAFAHEEHREVIVIIVGLLYIIVDRCECLSIVLVCMSNEAVSRKVHTIHIIELSPDILWIIKIRNGDNANASLLEELYVSARHIGNTLLRLFDPLGLNLGTPVVIQSNMLDKITLKGLREHTIDGAPSIRHQHMTESLHTLLRTFSVR